MPDLRRAVVLLSLPVVVIVVSALNWADTELTVANVGGVVVVGLTLGAIYAVSASGLVVVYTTTGVFNFAQGAIGMYWAFVYWELRVNRGWPAPLALLLVVFVLAPVGGVVLDRIIMRRLLQVPLVLQLMVTVGLMLGFMGIAATQWKGDRGRRLQPFFGSNGFEFLDVTVTWHRLITILVAIGIALFLRLLLFRARIGVAMRAVVDSRPLAALTGANPERISAVAWGLGSSLGAIAGILIAPDSGLVVEVLTLVIIDAFAAAAVGRLRSLPWTFGGAILLGLTQQYMRVFLDFEGGFSRAADALPTILLFVVVIMLPHAQLQTHGTGPPVQRRPRLTSLSDGAIGAVAIFVLILAWTGGTLPFTDAWSSVGINRGVTMMVTAIIMLSLVPLTGWAGQVSFAPMAFAGVGAVVFMKITGDSGNASGLLLAALFTAPVGALMALPAARLQGLYLALASMAFARGFELLFFTQTSVINPNVGGRQFAPLDLFGLAEFQGNGRGYLLFLTVVFGLMLLGLVALRRSRWGRRWVAINDSEAAAATLGISVVETKVVVFMVSAALAGFGGALFGLQQGTLNVLQFELLLGLPIVLLLVVGGVSYPSAAFFGGVNTVLFIVIKDRFDWSWLTALEVLGPGLMAVAMVANPNGAVVEIGKGFARFLPWRADARRVYAEEVVANREPEPGEMGLIRPFRPDEIVALDRRLGVLDDITPPTGYGTVS